MPHSVNSTDFTSSGCDTPPDAGGTTGIFMRSRAGPSMIEIRRMSHTTSLPFVVFSIADLT
ncbi:hypothetical protein T06_10688 [Trichinella sp. T6]|nr:hypothetical protein T06_10688 [Trichinella sp. T6]